MALVDSLMAFLQSLQGLPAYALLYGLLFASGFGLPINEDVLLLASAALTLKGVMDPLPLIAVAWCGLLTADGMIFHWGHRFGSRLLRHRWMGRWLPEAKLSALQAKVQRHGPAWLFAVRFMPGLRSALFFAAGSLKMRYRHLLVYDGAAALVELPVLVWGVRYLGGRWEDIIGVLQRFQGWLVPAALLLVVAVLIGRRLR